MLPDRPSAIDSSPKAKDVARSIRMRSRQPPQAAITAPPTSMPTPKASSFDGELPDLLAERAHDHQRAEVARWRHEDHDDREVDEHHADDAMVTHVRQPGPQVTEVAGGHGGAHDGRDGDQCDEPDADDRRGDVDDQHRLEPEPGEEGGGRCRSEQHHRRLDAHVDAVDAHERRRGDDLGQQGADRGRLDAGTRRIGWPAWRRPATGRPCPATAGWPGRASTPRWSRRRRSAGTSGCAGPPTRRRRSTSRPAAGSRRPSPGSGRRRTASSASGTTGSRTGRAMTRIARRSAR